MGVALSPYRVLGERPPAEALRVLPVIEVRAPLVLSENATFDDEDFAVVRYVEDHERDDAPHLPQPQRVDATTRYALSTMLAIGFIAAFITVVICEFIHTLR